MRRTAAMIGLAGLMLGSGCSPNLWRNLVEEAQGNLFVQFINNTPYRASFTAGAFDDLDRDPPGPVDIQQRAVEGGTSTAAIQFACGRDFAIGTSALLARVRAVGADSGANFNEDLFGERVSFSSAPAGTDAANLPTEGEALGKVFRLAVDYTCNSQLLVIFEEDADAPGGFRIDLTVIESPD